MISVENCRSVADPDAVTVSQTDLEQVKDRSKQGGDVFKVTSFNCFTIKPLI